MSGDIPGGTDLYGTADQLRAHLNQLAEADQPSGADKFTLAMGELLVQRIEKSPRGLVPVGFNLAVELLVAECVDSGIDGFTGEPLPRTVTSQHPAVYSAFTAIVAPVMAREAFGDEYADAYDAVRRAMYARLPGSDLPQQ